MASTRNLCESRHPLPRLYDAYALQLANLAFGDTTQKMECACLFDVCMPLSWENEQFPVCKEAVRPTSASGQICGTSRCSSPFPTVSQPAPQEVSVRSSLQRSVDRPASPRWLAAVCRGCRCRPRRRCRRCSCDDARGAAEQAGELPLGSRWRQMKGAGCATAVATAVDDGRAFWPQA